MKFIIGVVTFAATQLQIANLSLCQPEFKDWSEPPVPQTEEAPKTVTLNVDVPKGDGTVTTLNISVTTVSKKA